MNRTLSFALLATATLAVSAAFAQSSTKAGTQIQNQATATYTDSSGKPQVATSNLAVTVVQQVYGVQVKPDNGNTATGPSNFTLSPDPTNDKQGVPSSSVSFAYAVTNTGNDTDSITLATVEQANLPAVGGDDFDFVAGSIKMYQDNNANGQLDAGEPQITSALSIAGGASVNVVVVATVPSPSATVANGKVARLDLTATTPGGGTPKSDFNNIAKLTVINDANLTLIKTATGPDASNNISYSLTGTNTGSQAAKSIVDVAATVDGATPDGILIADALPTGTTLVHNSANGSAGSLGTTTTVVYYVAGVWTKIQPAFGAIGTVARVGLLIEDPTPANNTSENTLNVSAGYSLTFKVLIGSSQAGGSTIQNNATIRYDRQTPVGGGLTTTSNTTNTTVPVTKGVAIGNATSATVGAESQAAVAPVAAGQTITFLNKLQNTGNVDDTFLVTVDSFTCTPTTGYNIQLFQSDGVSPLSSLIALTKNQIYNVFVKVTIPGTSAVSNACTINLKAASSTDTSKFDPTTDTLTVTVAASALFGHSNGSTPVANAITVGTAVTLSGNPGAFVVFPQDVVNLGGSPDSFNLSGSITFNNVGSGTTAVAVRYYPASADTDIDNTLSVSEIANATPISNTGSISSNNEVKVFAVVNIPSTAVAATGLTVNQTATSPTSGVSVAFIDEKITVNTISGLTFTPNGSGTTTSPGTLVYSHTLKNTGNSNLTTANLTWTNPSGFTYVIYNDNGSVPGSIDATDTVITPSTNFSLSAGSTMNVLVQVTTANGLTSGVSDARVITAATGPIGGATTVTATVTDTTTIVAGELQLTKASSTSLATLPDGKTQAQPRTYLVQNSLPMTASEITYTINAKNVGTANLTDVIVFDAIPNFTDFKFGTVAVTLNGTACLPATCVIEYSTDGGSVWGATIPGDTNTNGYSDETVRVTNIRVRVNGSFVPAQVVVITFTVSVR
jgi:trimeric autotransporter adhesin